MSDTRWRGEGKRSREWWSTTTPLGQRVTELPLTLTAYCVLQPAVWSTAVDGFEYRAAARPAPSGARTPDVAAAGSDV